MKRFLGLTVALTLLFFIQGMATPPDSIGVKEENGKMYILHRVEKGEGLFAISRRYDVSIDLIMEANPQTEEGLVLGEIIMVPVIEEERIPGATYHDVKKGETLYSISRQYNAEVRQLRMWNKLRSNEIEPGDLLIVKMPPVDSRDNNNGQGRIVPPGEVNDTPDLHAGQESGTVARADSLHRKGHPEKDETAVDDEYASKYELKQKKIIKPSGEVSEGWLEIIEEGKASWISDTYMSTRKSLALHKDAPPGTIIKVENLMNNKVVYVKVVGYLDETRNDGKTIITISQSAAEKINVHDDFFRARLVYILKEKGAMHAE